MKQRIAFVLFLYVLCCTPAQTGAAQKPVLNTLEDFFRFEDLDQLTAYFGSENVFTERSYFGDPNKGAKSYLLSQVNFGTPRSVLLIWDQRGKQLCEVKASAYFYDFEGRKIKWIPNAWKTIQGVHAGMELSRLEELNWFAITFKVRPGDPVDGTVIPGFGRLKERRKVPFSTQTLVYAYFLDLKRINDFLLQPSGATLKSNNKTVRKWNPLLELVTIYREGLKPDP